MGKMPLKPLPDQASALASAESIRPLAEETMLSEVEDEVKTKAYSAMLGLYGSTNKFSGLKPYQVVVRCPYVIYQ